MRIGFVNSYVAKIPYIAAKYIMNINLWKMNIHTNTAFH